MESMGSSSTKPSALSVKAGQPQDFDPTETVRVHAQLVRRGHRHGRKRVARIMRASGLRGRAAKRWKKTTIADPAARCDHGRWCHTRRQGSHELRSVS
jgi:transposase InsO family protein